MTRSPWVVRPFPGNMGSRRCTAQKTSCATSGTSFGCTRSARRTRSIRSPCSPAMLWNDGLSMAPLITKHTHHGTPRETMERRTHASRAALNGHRYLDLRRRIVHGRTSGQRAAGALRAARVPDERVGPQERATALPHTYAPAVAGTILPFCILAGGVRIRRDARGRRTCSTGRAPPYAPGAAERDLRWTASTRRRAPAFPPRAARRTVLARRRAGARRPARFPTRAGARAMRRRLRRRFPAMRDFAPFSDSDSPLSAAISAISAAVQP